GFGAGSVRGALVWTAAATATIVLCRWLAVSTLTANQPWLALHQQNQHHWSGSDVPSGDARDYSDRSLDRSLVSPVTADASNVPFGDASGSSDRSQDRSLFSPATAAAANSATASREQGADAGTVADDLAGESELRQHKQEMRSSSLFDANLDIIPSAGADADDELFRGKLDSTVENSGLRGKLDSTVENAGVRGKNDVTVENAGRVPRHLDRGSSSAGDGSNVRDISHEKNGGGALFEQFSDRRGQALEGEAFSSSPSEMLSATLEEFSVAIGEFSEISKAWLEEVASGGAVSNDATGFPGLQEGFQEGLQERLQEGLQEEGEHYCGEKICAKNEVVDAEDVQVDRDGSGGGGGGNMFKGDANDGVSSGVT
ncbi:unnamed protein product, partial [Laminaria digitata]